MVDLNGGEKNYSKRRKVGCENGDFFPSHQQTLNRRERSEVSKSEDVNASLKGMVKSRFWYIEKKRL